LTDPPIREVLRPWAPDVVRIVLVASLVGAAFLLVTWAAVGERMLLGIWYAWPAAMAVIVPYELFVGFPSRVARRVSADASGCTIVRRQASEQYSWATVRSVGPMRSDILYGAVCRVELRRPGEGVGRSILLTRAQRAVLERARTSSASVPTRDAGRH
jgi:hypothetical protein